MNEQPDRVEPASSARGLTGRMIDAAVAPFVQPVVDAVDIDDVIDRIDPNALLDRVDPNALLDRVDPNALLDRVDPNALLDRVDPNALLDRVDIDAFMDRVDVNAVVSRTEIGEIIARSTTGVFGHLVDTGRVAVMSLDLALHGVVARLLRRDEPTSQRGPGVTDERSELRLLVPGDRAVALQGRYAGAVSRFLAFLMDSTISGASFGLMTALFTLALEVVANVSLTLEEHRLLVGLTYVTWQFVYFAGLTALAGRTIGKGVLGLFVVDRDGPAVTARGATFRTLAFPLSFLLFGAGFMLGVVRRDRRQLHDLIGGTAVVYAWDAELARLRSGPLRLQAG